MEGNLSSTEWQFVNNCNSLHEYVAFANNGYLKPVAIGKINNQDLHNPQLTDLLIVSHPTLLAQAQRLAQYHQQRDGLKSSVVTTEQVYNEFSFGSPDPTAIRDFVKCITTADPILLKDLNTFVIW
jgi:hypothetical protein